MRDLQAIIWPLALIVVFICITVLVVRLVQPWYRRHPTPRRSIDYARDAVTLWRIHKRHPQVFETDAFTKLAERETDPIMAIRDLAAASRELHEAKEVSE